MIRNDWVGGNDVPAVTAPPLLGATELDLRPRALSCLHTFERADDLSAGLESAGYVVQSVDAVADLNDLIAADDDIVVVLHEGIDDWLRLVADLVHAKPLVRPIVLGALDNPEEFLAAVAAGVVGFCAADAELDAIVRTIDDVRATGVAVPRGMVGPLVARVRHGRGHTVRSAAGLIDLTDREWEVMQLLLQRRSTREMATELFVSVGTVRSHISTLLSKLGAVDREDAIALIERGRSF